MLLIIAHHYVANSDLAARINSTNISGQILFLRCFVAWGKIGINCFVLITGYYMCCSKIRIGKFLRLYFEVVFYNIVIGLLFEITGYDHLSLFQWLKKFITFGNLNEGFTSSYFILYLFIPFLNILVNVMNEKQHRTLVLLTLCVFSVWSQMPFVVSTVSYLVWFIVLYIVAAYIRIYNFSFFSNTKFWLIAAIVAVICSISSILVLSVTIIGNRIPYWYFVADSQKITAFAVALCLFMLFKNMNITYNRFINRIACSIFGVYNIHTNSGAMRQWLWNDTFKNSSFFDTPYMIPHAFFSVIVVFVLCTIIDQFRIYFVEKPFLPIINFFTDTISHIIRDIEEAIDRKLVYGNIKQNDWK